MGGGNVGNVLGGIQRETKTRGVQLWKARLEWGGKHDCHLEKGLPGFISFVNTSSQGCMAQVHKSLPVKVDMAGHHYSMVLAWKKWVSKEKSISSNFELNGIKKIEENTSEPN